MPVDPICHCGVEKSRHRWEDHAFVEMPEEEPAPVPSLTGIVAWEGRTDGRGGTWSREAVERLGRFGGVKVEERDGELVATLTTEVSPELYASIRSRPVGCSIRGQ